jgi:hypothetical protein
MLHLFGCKHNELVACLRRNQKNKLKLTLNVAQADLKPTKEVRLFFYPCKQERKNLSLHGVGCTLSVSDDDK